MHDRGTIQEKGNKVERERSKNTHIDSTATIGCSGEDLSLKISMILYL